MVHSGRRPTVATVSASGDPGAVGQDERAGADAAAGLLHDRGDAEPAGLQLVVDRQLDRDRAHEVVALFPGVLAGGLAQLGAEGFVDVGEPGVVVGAEPEGEVVGDDPAALDVDRAVLVHLPHEAPTELDRADAALEGAGEHALDHTLYAVLERLQAHAEDPR